MIPVNDRRQQGEYDDQLIIKRSVEYPYESKVIQLLVLLANLALFISGVHLLVTQQFEKWLWSSPFFIIYIGICFYFIRYLHFLTGHNHTMLYKEYKKMLKTYNHELFKIHIENEGSVSERIVCRLKIKGEEENSDLNSAIIPLEEETDVEIEMDETQTDQDNVNLI
ncbi:predicted protein [Naegleria gruberi]|uniref:Predicted protein n=1 Tax=Naegleria gruberi TaxID=5762 RepID=D2VZ48_NAEGR|nr:uncharacterized protein NAEGRDRAFT_74357 [Naegleria gruberi]EFC37880.1 predicted protein [Naegleria gruberi]|eukprot:XP_002670624.1 predicted protein [Naegleria gruberi strain NEG-M]